MSLYFALLTVENNKNKKSVKFQGDILNFGDFIYVFVFTTNHHLNHSNSTYWNALIRLQAGNSDNARVNLILHQNIECDCLI